MAIAQLSLEAAGILSVWLEVSSEHPRQAFSEYLSYTDALVWYERLLCCVATAAVLICVNA
jgi:hypothetical protein